MKGSVNSACATVRKNSGLLILAGRAFVLSVGVSGSSVSWAIEWPQNAEYVVDQLVSESPEERIDALRTLVLSSDAGMVDALRRALGDPAPEVRESALQLVAELQLTEFAGAVYSLLTHRSVEVRTAAARCAGQLGGPGAVDALARLLADPDPGVRAAAIQGLATSGGPGTASTIASALGDRDIAVVRAAAQALATLRQSATVFALLEAATSPNEERAVAAIEALASLEDPRSLEALSELALDVRPAVAIAAITALGRVGDESTESILLQQAQRPSDQPQPAAALAALVGTSQPFVLNAVLPVLFEPGRDGLIREIFVAAGEAAWPVLRAHWASAGQDENADGILLSLWVQTGDPVAMQTLMDMRTHGLSDDQYMLALRWARSPDALCMALEVPSLARDFADELVANAVRQGAVECLRMADSSLGAPSDAVLADALLTSELPWSPWMEALVVSRLSRSGPLTESALQAVSEWLPRTSEGWYSLLLSDSSRLSREAAFVVADGGHHLWTASRVSDVVARRRERPWLLKSLLSAPAAMVCPLLSDESLWTTSLLQLERVELSGMCESAVRHRIQSDALVEADLWIVRAVHRLAPELTLGVASEDPWLAAQRLEAGSWDVVLDERASVDARVRSVAMLPASELASRVMEWLDVASPVVRAALWARSGTSVLEYISPADLQVRAHASTTAAEQAVLWAILIAAGGENPISSPSAVGLDPMVARALASDSLTSAEPLLVQVALEDGRPDRNAPLLVLFGDGTVELHRSDREGRWRTERPVHLLFHSWSRL